MFFNQKSKNQRGMILGLVLVICFILGVLAFESERLALHLRNETGLIKQWSQNGKPTQK